MKKTILITGCSRGIGLETVKLLLSEGHKIYACVRSIKNCDELYRLKSDCNQLYIKQMDLRNEGEIYSVVKEVEESGDIIDVVINNASYILLGPVELASSNQMEDQFRVNLFGPLNLVQALIPSMRKNRKGHIIFLGSTSGVSSSGIYGWYSASKFALESIAHALAINLSPWNISLSIVEPSATKTDIALKSLEVGNQTVVDNPYGDLLKKNRDFLCSIIDQGTSPKQVGLEILKAVHDPRPKFRYFATEFAENVFHKVLVDPHNIDLLKEINAIKSDL